MNRYETVDWPTFYSHGSVSLGDLRRYLREIADWPDDAAIDCKGITARRPLPLATAGEDGPVEMTRLDFQ